MKMIKCLLILTILINIFTPDISNANEIDTDNLKNYLEENNVSEKQKEILLEKIKNNEPWDVDKEENIYKIPDDFYIFTPQSGNQTRSYRFDDGSFIEISVTQNDVIELNGSPESNLRLKNKIKDKSELEKLLKEESVVSARGVENGSGYSRYYDYKVELKKGTMYSSMITEFVLVNGGNDYLVSSGFFEPIAKNFGQLGQMPAIDIVRINEDSSKSRWALANTNWYVNYPISTPWGGSTASGTKYLWLGVGKDTFKVSDTLPY